MKKIVVKFGGSNLRTPADIARIADLVALYKRPLVLVVSAFYGITNALINAVRDAKGEGNGASMASSNTFTHELRKLKEQIIRENIPGKVRQQEVLALTNTRLDQLERYLLGIHYIGDVPDAVNDMVLSYGERLSSLVLSEALKTRGFDCLELSPEEMGLCTDGEFGNAACDFDQSQPSVSHALEADRIFVVPGFYGIGPDGRPTLFGRGGSDYSAAAIARCIEAESLDMWKDVSGFLSADPGSVPAVHPISHLNYLEAAELSYFGAKILHPRTVEPLFDRNIPVRILDIRHPEHGLSPCTVIDHQRTISPQTVKSVTATEDIGIVKIHGPGVGFKSGILAKATGALDRHGINIKSVLTSQTAICLLLGKADLIRARSILAEHHISGVVNVSLVDEVALVAAVGDGVLDPWGFGSDISSRVLTAARNTGVRVALAGAGASEVAVYVIVHREDRSKAIESIHREFFGPS